ncbi:hypothetical protein H0901_13150 [Microcystis aeruginosa BLCCF158]|jgi:hypothetical protein|uniref:Uncharacterized protein n=1 Tax=Microcystis aeruginosa BLCC-F158 TaxID=2755316 RepID=A0A841V1Q9_MICAE|nr:hypothetical protein [Microcystis aeruginosa]MBC1196178.1 hypothetical protein [Microcystis aeruginosa BLCC-F158]
MSDATRLTLEEIQSYQELFKDYPEALDALDLINESDGDLIESANLLAAEAGIEISSRKGEDKDVNILDKLAQKCRSVICDDDFMDDLMSGLLTAGVATLTVSGQIPQAVATPVVIYLTKKGVKIWCQSN